MARKRTTGTPPSRKELETIKKPKPHTQNPKVHYWRLNTAPSSLLPRQMQKAVGASPHWLCHSRAHGLPGTPDTSAAAQLLTIDR